MKLSATQRQCLEWYRDREHVPSPEGRLVPPEARWNNRQMNWALDQGLLECGPNGWHILSEAGREALALSQQEGKDRT